MRCVPWQILSSLVLQLQPFFLLPLGRGTPFSLFICRFIHFTSSLQIQVIEDDRTTGFRAICYWSTGQVPPLSHHQLPGERPR